MKNQLKLLWSMRIEAYSFYKVLMPIPEVGGDITIINNLYEELRKNYE